MKEGGRRGANERSGETWQRVNSEHDCGQMWERKTRSKGCGGEARKLEVRKDDQDGWKTREDGKCAGVFRTDCVIEVGGQEGLQR